MSVISRGRSRTPGKLWQLALDTAAGAARQRSAQSVATRDPLHRRRYADDPWAYIADILGITLSQPQRKALEAVTSHDRVLLAGANNVGKTVLDACIALWFLDARGAQPGGDFEERGARVLLVGPDHSTIFQTVYAEMLSLARRAEARGHLMPGSRSTASVTWKVREKWGVEPFAPPQKAGQNQAHSAAGRHQREQLAIICEAQGVPDPVWKGVEGMCSTQGNIILAETNPTEAHGPFHSRSRLQSWRLVHLSALDHDNITQRRLVIPEAISWQKLESRIRDQCEELGPWPEVQPAAEYDDFIYALTPEEAAHPEAVRDDGFLGSAEGQPRIYRPRANFAPQSLGRYPKGGEQSLFDPAALDAAMARWRAAHVPEIPPDRVGLDSAYGQNDAICAVGAWGDDATTLLSRYQEAMSQGQPDAIELLREHQRCYIGRLHILPAAAPSNTARWMLDHFPKSHWMVEHAGGGEGVCDHASSTLKFFNFSKINPSGSPPPRLEEEIACDNVRASLYVRAAMLVKRGLVDVPDDPMLRQELMAMQLVYDRITTQNGERVQVARLISKKDLKKALGRSPDRASAFVFALCQPDAGEPGADIW